MDGNFGASWIGFATAFAKEGEHDQAIAAYCAADKIMKGRHEAKMFIGMQYIQQENYPLAKEFFEMAKSICSNDPSLENELGVYWYKVGNYQKARKFLENSLKLGQGLKRV